VDQGEQDWDEPRCGKGKLELKSFTVTRPVTIQEISDAFALRGTDYRNRNRPGGEDLVPACLESLQ